MLDKEQLKKYIALLHIELKKKLGLKSNPSNILFLEDVENAKNPFGFTAYYSPADKSVTLYVTDRHIKDILRSYAHEIVHFWQDENGKLQDSMAASNPAYAQTDPHLRKMEQQAYLVGNMIFRDFCDSMKTTDGGVNNG